MYLHFVIGPIRRQLRLNEEIGWSPDPVGGDTREFTFFQSYKDTARKQLSVNQDKRLTGNSICQQLDLGLLSFQNYGK